MRGLGRSLIDGLMGKEQEPDPSTKLSTPREALEGNPHLTDEVVEETIKELESRGVDVDTSPDDKPVTQEEDFIELPAVAIIVCMDAYLRLTRKGMPVDMPSELVEEETGITWKSVVPDFRTREIILLEIHDPYDLKAKKTIEHRIASDRFRTLLV